MTRYRIYDKKGNSFLSRKGQTLKELSSWKKAYNKYNRNKVITIVPVKEKIIKKPIKKITQSYGLFGSNPFKGY